MKRLSIRIPTWVYEFLVIESKKRGTSMNGLISQMCFELADVVKKDKQRRNK